MSETHVTNTCHYKETLTLTPGASSMSPLVRDSTVKLDSSRAWGEYASSAETQSETGLGQFARQTVKQRNCVDCIR